VVKRLDASKDYRVVDNSRVDFIVGKYKCRTQQYNNVVTVWSLGQFLHGRILWSRPISSNCRRLESTRRNTVLVPSVRSFKERLYEHQRRCYKRNVQYCKTVHLKRQNLTWDLRRWRQLLLECASSPASSQVNPMSFKSLRIMSCQFSWVFLVSWSCC